MKQAIVTRYDSKIKAVDVLTCEEVPTRIKNVRVKTLITESLLLHTPIEPGTPGVIMFPKECQQFVFEGKVEKTRLYDTISPIFFPGFNSFVQDCPVPEDAAYLKYGGVKITIKKDGSVKIENDTAVLLEEIVKSLEKLLEMSADASTHMYTPASGTPTPCAPNTPVVTAYQNEVNSILNKIKSFNE